LPFQGAELRYSHSDWRDSTIDAYRIEW